MHQSHIENLKTIHANLKHALRNSEVATIGGGTFGWAEQNTLRIVVECALINQYEHGSEWSRNDLRPLVEQIRRNESNAMEGDGK